jgi:hypothetical protein
MHLIAHEGALALAKPLSAVSSTQVKILRKETPARTWIRLLKPVDFIVVGVRLQRRARYARKRIGRDAALLTSVSYSR